MAGAYKVIDASFILNLLLDEEPNSDVLRFQEDYFTDKYALIAPDLIDYEIINALRSAVLQKRYTLDETAVFLRNYQDLEIKRIPLSSDTQQKALSLAVKNQCTSYDASYLMIALDYQAPILTLDKRLKKLWEELKN